MFDLRVVRNITINVTVDRIIITTFGYIVRRFLYTKREHVVLGRIAVLSFFAVMATRVEEKEEVTYNIFMKKNDLILIGSVLVVALLLLLGIKLYGIWTTKDGQAVVTINGEEVKRFPLNQDTEFLFETEYGYNRLVIKDGEAMIREADCPDGICAGHNAISKQKETIVCLPHKLVVTIENGEEGEFDAIAQ